MKFWKLDSIRGLAAVYVVLGHVWGTHVYVFRLGQEVVMVFFLISGFVIEYSCAQQPEQTFLKYAAKRFVRIYVPLLAMFVLVFLLQRPPLFDPDFLRVLAGNLFMLQDFAPGKPNVIVPTLFASALWSLHYEWWFYMMYYPCNRFIQRDRQAKIVGITGILCAALYYFYPLPLIRLLMYFPVWWVGVEMARSFAKNNRVNGSDLRPILRALAIVCLIVIAGCAAWLYSGNAFLPGLHPFLETRHLIAGLVASGLALVWQHFGWKGFSPLRVGCWVAPASYALYISHQPLWAEAEYLHFIPNAVVEQSLYFLACLVFSWSVEMKIYPYVRDKMAGYLRERKKSPVSGSA